MSNSLLNIQSSNPAEVKTVYLEAYAIDDVGDGPRYAAVQLTPELWARIKSLALMCEVHKLAYVVDHEGPERDAEDELRLTNHEMMVDSSSVWFRATPKHCFYSVETRAVPGARLETFLESNDEVMYFGDNCEQLAEMVQAELVESAHSEGQRN